MRSETVPRDERDERFDHREQEQMAAGTTEPRDVSKSPEIDLALDSTDAYPGIC